MKSWSFCFSCSIGVQKSRNEYFSTHNIFWTHWHLRSIDLGSPWLFSHPLKNHSHALLSTTHNCNVDVLQTLCGNVHVRVYLFNHLNNAQPSVRPHHHTPNYITRPTFTYKIIQQLYIPNFGCFLMGTGSTTYKNHSAAVN